MTLVPLERALVPLDVDTPLWLVRDPLPEDDARDCCSRTTLDEFRLQFGDGLDVDRHPAFFTTESEALAEAKGRVLVGRVARQVRSAPGLPLDEVARVTLHGEDGRVLYEGEVR